jgi:hypothetical protein
MAVVVVVVLLTMVVVVAVDSDVALAFPADKSSLRMRASHTLAPASSRACSQSARVVRVVASTSEGKGKSDSGSRLRSTAAKAAVVAAEDDEDEVGDEEEEERAMEESDV